MKTEKCDTTTPAINHELHESSSDDTSFSLYLNCKFIDARNDAVMNDSTIPRFSRFHNFHCL